MITFAVVGHILFPVEPFRSFVQSAMSCLNMMMGSFDGYEEMAQWWGEDNFVSSLVPLAYFWSYTFLMLLVSNFLKERC